MVCAFPWVMHEAHILNIFQHCLGQWREGEVTRNVSKKYQKNTIYIYQGQMF